jgi:hypothetical protein
VKKVNANLGNYPYVVACIFMLSIKKAGMN